MKLLRKCVILRKYIDFHFVFWRNFDTEKKFHDLRSWWSWQISWMGNAYVLYAKDEKMRQDSCAVVAVLPLRRPPPSPTCRWRRAAAGWTRRWARLRTRSRSSLNSGAPPFPHHNTWGRKNKDLELLFKKLHKKTKPQQRLSWDSV